MQDKFESHSEKRGLQFLSPTDQRVYCVGISTGGSAEIKMACTDAKRQIIATTIDPQGAVHAKQRIAELGLSNQIEVKIEDVSQPLPYDDGFFDYIYARLVLHYLPKNALMSGLQELNRTLRANGRMFVVVRSVNCPEAQDKTAKLDLATGLTTYFSGGKPYSRYFHSQESITHYLTIAGFTIEHVEEYQEQLCVDFHRTQLSNHVDTLIEVLTVITR